VSDRVRQEQRTRRAIQRAVRRLLGQYKKSKMQDDRREHRRSDFMQPVKVRTDDDREFMLLTRDMSISGLRLIGTRGFLGQRLVVEVPAASEGDPVRLAVRILWTYAVGDGLFENGGVILEAQGGLPKRAGRLQEEAQSVK
jgi:hypothetical protein